VSRPKLALGTVQWGMPYGIANQSGQPDEREIRALLALAGERGIDTLDTGRAYGSSEAVIGRVVGPNSAFEVVTKTDPALTDDAADAATALARLHTSLQTSRELLRRPVLDTVLLHRPAHRTALGGAIWDALRKERADGGVGRIGVSALTPEDAFEALEDEDVQVMQVASSLLDRRLHDAGFFQEAQLRDVEIHVRSVFLQGAAFLDAATLPEPLADLASSLVRLDEVAATSGVHRAVLFWAWARRLGANRLLVGCERAWQLEEHLAWFEAAETQDIQVTELASELPTLGVDVLDPSRWP